LKSVFFSNVKLITHTIFTANNVSTTTHRPYHKATTTTTRYTTTTVATTETPAANKKDNDCPGVCVADRIADYCEAYLKTPNLCKPSTKCCVAKDSYMDNPDLRVLIGTQSSNNKTPLKPQKTSEKV
jgi:Clip-domain serine protease homolog masquerade